MQLTWEQVSHCKANLGLIPCSGKLSREKTYANFEVLWLFVIVFGTKFGGVASFGGTSKQSVKVFSAKNLLFH